MAGCLDCLLNRAYACHWRIGLFWHSCKVRGIIMYAVIHRQSKIVAIRFLHREDALFWAMLNNATLDLGEGEPPMYTVIKEKVSV